MPLTPDELSTFTAAQLTVINRLIEEHTATKYLIDVVTELQQRVDTLEEQQKVILEAAEKKFGSGVAAELKSAVQPGQALYQIVAAAKRYVETWGNNGRACRYHSVLEEYIIDLSDPDLKEFLPQETHFHGLYEAARRSRRTSKPEAVHREFMGWGHAPKYTLVIPWRNS